MLEGVRNQFRDHHSHCNALIHIQRHVALFHRHSDSFSRGAIRLAQVAAEFLEVDFEVDSGQVLGQIQGLVNQRHSVHPAPTVIEDLSEARVVDTSRMHPQQTDNDLHVVLDAMMDFAQEDFLFFERGTYQLF